MNTALDGAGDPPAILVVERDPDIGGQLVDQLVADGYPARLARTAEHARVLARARPPSLALLGELETPRAALELLEEIRAPHGCGGSPRLAHGDAGGPWPTHGSAWGSRPVDGGVESPWPAGLSVIVIGSQAHEPDLLRAFEAGADDFLPRPARYLELRGVNFNSWRLFGTT